MMSPATLTLLFILFLASELQGVGAHDDKNQGQGPSLQDVKFVRCPAAAPFKCVEANGYCYGFTEYCDNVDHEVKTCFVGVTDIEDFCRSGRPSINPQCVYACNYQIGWNMTEMLLLDDPKESKCPLYSCKNSTGTKCYGYDSYCTPDGVVESCFPEGIDTNDARLDWCQSRQALLNDQCKYACIDQKNDTQITSQVSKESKCPLYSCKNSTGTKWYGYDSYCTTDGVVKSCFPEGRDTSDARLEWCQSRQALLNDHCRCACIAQKNDTQIITQEKTESSWNSIMCTFLTAVPSTVLNITGLISLIILTITLCWWRKNQKNRKKPSTEIEEKKEPTQGNNNPDGNGDQLNKQVEERLEKEAGYAQRRNAQVDHGSHNNEESLPLKSDNKDIALYGNEDSANGETSSSNNSDDVSIPIEEEDNV